MRKWKATVLYGLIFVVINHFSLITAGASYDYDYDDQKDSRTRCPWIRNKLKNGRVRIRSRGRIAKFSCKSGYEMVGKRFATCVRGQWNNPIPLCITKGCPKISAPSNGHVTEQNEGAQLVFDCGPGYSLFGESTIYCDGTDWDKEPATCQATTLQPKTSCDFEDPDLCGWTHDPNHHFDWKRHQFQTPSFRVRTGPSFDHTFGEGKAGYYMYIEASSPRNENDTARLFSPVYSKHYSPGCFVFWYHMYGATIGKLRVYIMPASSIFGELTPSWEMQGNQGDQWFMANITVPAVNENFQIIIEGIIGASYIGDSAIDDVRLHQSDCSSLDSANSTENSEASQDSCRGRCHEQDNSTSCGCTVTCESNNTCCLDYSTLCAADNASSIGEDESGEYLTSGGVSEVNTSPAPIPGENVGTVYTVTPEVLYTESITGTVSVSDQSLTSTQQSSPSTTESIPVVTAIPLSTSVTNQETPVATTVGTTGPSTVSTETSVSPETNIPVKVTTQSTLSTAKMEVSTTTTATDLTPTTTTIATTSTERIVIRTSGNTAPARVTSAGASPYTNASTFSTTSDSRRPTLSTLLTSRASTMSTSTTTTETATSKSEPEPVPAIETTTNRISSVENSVSSGTTSVATILAGTSATVEPESVPTTVSSTQFIVSSRTTPTISTQPTTSPKIFLRISSTSQPVTLGPVSVRTTPPIISTRTDGRRTTPPITSTTSAQRTIPEKTTRTIAPRSTPPRTSTTDTLRTTQPVTSTTGTVRTTQPLTSTTGTVRTTQPVTSKTDNSKTTPLVTFSSVVLPKTTIRKYRPWTWSWGQTTPEKFSRATSGTTNMATSIKPTFYTTDSQPTEHSSESENVHAAKTTADMHSGHGPNVLGICVGVALLLGLVGAVAFVYLRRRRQMRSKLRDDSELRFLSDSEVIEYSDASALDRLVH